MRSPFPGMDPWLELRWRDVHASLITLDPPLPPEDAAWADDVLRKAGRL